MAQVLAATANTYGHPVLNWSWIFPALFFTAVAIALAPVVWLWVQGQLSLWLIPLVTGLTVMAAVVATPHLRLFDLDGEMILSRR